MFGLFRRPGTEPDAKPAADSGQGADQLAIQPIGVMVPAVLASGIGTAVWVPDSQHVGPPGTKPGYAPTTARSPATELYASVGVLVYQWTRTVRSTMLALVLLRRGPLPSLRNQRAYFCFNETIQREGVHSSVHGSHVLSMEAPWKPCAVCRCTFLLKFGRRCLECQARIVAWAEVLGCRSYCMWGPSSRCQARMVLVRSKRQGAGLQVDVLTRFGTCVKALLGRTHATRKQAPCQAPQFSRTPPVRKAVLGGTGGIQRSTVPERNSVTPPVLSTGAARSDSALSMPSCRWARATVMGLKDDGCLVLVKADAGWESELPAVDCHVQNDRDDALDDLVKSDYLHEAGWGSVI